MFTQYAEVKAFLRDGTLMKACIQASKELMHLCEKAGVKFRLYPDVLFVHRPSSLVVAMIRRIWTNNMSMQCHSVLTVSTGGLLETGMHYDAMLCTAKKPVMELPSLEGLETFFKANRNQESFVKENIMSPQKKVVLFLFLTLSFSTISYIPLIRAGTGSTQGELFVIALMWSPGLAAILTQFIATRSLRGLGWRLGSVRWLGIAYILPVVYALPVYFFTWLTGLGRLLNPYVFSPMTRQYSPSNLVTALIVFVLIKASKGVVENLVFQMGEEIGWRGLLVPELAKMTSFTKTALISGIVWASWHMPAIFLANYNSGITPIAFSATCFAILIVAISFPFAWLTLKSGSLWPAVLLHTSHNIFVQGVFDRLTGDNTITPYITGEFGIGLALTSLVVAYVMWRTQKNIRGERNRILPQNQLATERAR